MNLISRVCIPNPPIFDKITVTILGAVAPLGGTIALLLKQCRTIDLVKLYASDGEACSAAVDLSSLDTKTKVIAYEGNNSLLIDAVKDANIVVICGGEANSMSDKQTNLFNQNVDGVRYLALHVSEYNPTAIVLLATPPINSLVPLISQEFKKAGVYDHRKIIGLSNIATMRANALIGAFLKKDPSLYMCPTIGGLCPLSIVPVFSQTSPSFSMSEKERMKLLMAIKYAENSILDKKFIDNTGSCYLSIALAITRFIKNQVDAMLGNKSCFECAYVRQMGHISDFLPYMSTICKLGPHGVEATFMPKLDDFECKQLKKAYPILRDAIRKGESFVDGGVYKDTRVKTIGTDTCDLVTRSPVEVVGDITVDLSRKYKRFKVYQ